MGGNAGTSTANADFMRFLLYAKCSRSGRNVEQRTPGGLGIFLVKRLAGDLRHEFQCGRNILTFRKSLPV